MFRPFCAHRRGKVTRSSVGPVGLKMPDLARYDTGLGNGWAMLRRCVPVFGLMALGLALDGVHQMRRDLGRLAAGAEIVQIGPALARHSA
ncbi:hypothetical protein CF64_39330 [Bradyrhizobium japonicum]|nr:hypothetical protein CF64_39330 [Bradyrhizobium japonicum]